MFGPKILVCAPKGQELVESDYTTCAECGCDIAYSKRAPKDVDAFICMECAVQVAAFQMAAGHQPPKRIVAPETAAELAEYFKKKGH